MSAIGTQDKKPLNPKEKLNKAIADKRYQREKIERSFGIINASASSASSPKRGGNAKPSMNDYLKMVTMEREAREREARAREDRAREDREREARRTIIRTWDMSQVQHAIRNTVADNGNMHNDTSNDEEIARRLQEEENKRAIQIDADEAYARTLAEA